MHCWVHVQSPPLSLVNLFPTILPESRRAPIKEKIKLMPDGRWKMPLKITPDGTVGVQDQRCPQCHRKLRKYGYIECKKVHVPPQFQALSPRITRFERYFCPEHGEIFINHEALVTQHGQYHEIYMRQSRLLYAIGLTPNKIYLIFLAIDQLYIPENTILTWIWEMHVELPLLLAPAEMPCSGYLMYDEIHLRLEHHKQYAQILMDGYFGFIINVCVAAELSKETVTQFFLKNVIEPILPCISVTTDDHSTIGAQYLCVKITHDSKILANRPQKRDTCLACEFYHQANRCLLQEVRVFFNFSYPYAKLNEDFFTTIRSVNYNREHNFEEGDIGYFTLNRQKVKKVRVIRYEDLRICDMNLELLKHDCFPIEIENHEQFVAGLN